MPYQVVQTETFAAWHTGLRDMRAKVAIARRIERIQAGTLGDVKSLGGVVSELRVDIGPGYRLYFTMRKRVVVILLCGGDKKTQRADIRHAQKNGRRGVIVKAKAKKNEKLVPFDMAAFLDSPEAIAEYLTQVLADGEPDELLRALGHIAKARGMAQIAEDAGMGRESLYKALAPGAHPRYDTVLKVMRSLGVRLAAEPIA